VLLAIVESTRDRINDPDLVSRAVRGLAGLDHHGTTAPQHGTWSPTAGGRDHFVAGQVWNVPVDGIVVASADRPASTQQARYQLVLTPAPAGRTRARDLTPLTGRPQVAWPSGTPFQVEEICHAGRPADHGAEIHMRELP